MPRSKSAHSDRLITALAGLAVCVLGTISAAISYTHTVTLAEAHHETGWRAHSLPLSIDGLEVVASLVLLAEHRTGRRAGRQWLPWAALAAGTVASLAANIVVAEPSAVGRTISAWPAVAFLVGIKLGTRMLGTPQQVRHSSPEPVPEPEPGPEPEPPPVTVEDRAGHAGTGTAAWSVNERAGRLFPEAGEASTALVAGESGPGRPGPERRIAAVTWCLEQHRATGRWPTGTEIARHWQCTDRNGRKVRAAAQAALLTVPVSG